VTDPSSGYMIGWGDSVAVTVAGLKPQLTSVHVTLGSATADVPLQPGVVADDSAIVMAMGKTIDVAANDAPDVSNVRIVGPPTHASATVVGGAIRVQPSGGFLGRDSLRYVATAAGRTDTATLRLAVMPGPYSVAAVVDLTPVSAIQGMNDSGQVYATIVLADKTTRALRWTAGRIDTLQYGGAATMATGMDASGLVVGMSGSTAVLWRPGMTEGESILGNTGTGALPRISSGGTIVLNDPVALPQFQYNHFVVKGGVIEQSLSQIRAADAVDDAGDYMGIAARGELYPPGIVHYADGHVSFFGGRGTDATGMNNHAAVVCNAGISGSDPAYRPMLFDGRTQAVLSDSLTTLSVVLGINDAGWIQGLFVSTLQTRQPALVVGGAAVPFQSLLADQSLVLNDPIGLSNSDRVLARVTGTGGSYYVILRPVN
jgi:uncharacterized membrane protein